MKSTVIWSVIMLIGIGILGYPFVSQWVYAKNQTEVIESYQDDVLKLDKKELAEIKEKIQDYIAACDTDMVQEEESTENVPTGYVDVLDVGEVMGYLEIPKIHISLPIYHGTDEMTLEKGVGHMKGTSLPTGGKGMHAVLAGHSGLAKSTLFSHLDQMEKGDVFYLHVLDETLCYEVDDIKTVEPDDLEVLQAVPGKDYVTLLTCTPKGINTHRLLVRGERVENEENKETNVTKYDQYEMKKMLFILGGLILLWIIIIIWKIKGRGQRV